MGQVWYCLIDGQEVGPIGSSEVRQLVTSGKLRPTDWIRQDPQANWVSAGKTRGLFPEPVRDCAQAPPCPQQEAARWIVCIDDREFGPFPDSVLKRYAAEGRVRPDHFVRLVDQSALMRAGSIRGLFSTAATGGSNTTAASPPPTVKFACETCKRPLRASIEYVGRQFSCPACQGVVIVPGAGGAVDSKSTPEEPIVVRAAQQVASAAARLGTAAARKATDYLSTALSPAPDLRPPRDRIEFYGPHAQVNLGFGPIVSPLVYATGQRYSSVYDASLVELPLPVQRRGTMGERLPYWPSYHDSSPSQRANYLEWLYGGRKDPTIELGYVFIFFYGLERRVLVDDTDHELVINELLRLLPIYGHSRSFQGYATSLLWLTLFLSADRAGVSTESLTRLFDATSHWTEETLNLCLGYHLRRELPIDVRLAYLLAEQDERSPQGVVIRRQAEAFGRLFAMRYTAQFPNGLLLRPGARETKIEYRPASGTLLAMRSRLPAIATRTQPRLSSRASQLAPLVELWSECLNELRDYDREARQSPLGQMTGEMYEALPTELRKGNHPDQSAWMAAINEHADEGGWPLMPIGALARIKGMPTKDRLTKRQCEGLLSTADALGLAIEPDARLTGKNYTWEQPVVVFHEVGEQPTSVQLSAYRAASALLELGLSIAQADDTVDEDELGRITVQLEQQFDLGDRLTKRLEAHKHLLLMHGTDHAAVARYLQKALTLQERRLVGEYLVGVAAADELVTDDEKQVLRKIYRSLDIPLVHLDAQLEKCGTVPSVVVGESVTAASPGPEAEEEEEVVLTPTLDLDRIRRIREETSRVQELLHAALSADIEANETEAYRESSSGAVAVADVEPIGCRDDSEKLAAVDEHLSDAQSHRFSTLVERYRLFALILVSRDSWIRAELADKAREHGLMLSAGLEVINEWSTDTLGDWLIEELEERIVVHRHLLESV